MKFDLNISIEWGKLKERDNVGEIEWREIEEKLLMQLKLLLFDDLQQNKKKKNESTKWW